VREAAFVTHRKSISFVCLSVHHQDIGVIMTHDFKAHVPFPPAELDSRARRGAPAVTSVLTDIVCRLPPSSAATRARSDVASGAQQGRKWENSLQTSGPAPESGVPMGGQDEF
jgi:hypothetical protein